MSRAVLLLLLLLASPARAGSPYDDYCEFAPQTCAEFERRGWDLRLTFSTFDVFFEEVTINETFVGFLVQHEEAAILRFFDRFQRLAGVLNEGAYQFQYYFVSTLNQTPEFFEAIGGLSDAEALQFGELISYPFSGLVRGLALRPDSIGPRLKAHLGRVLELNRTNPRFAGFLRTLDSAKWGELGRVDGAAIEDTWGHRFVDYLSDSGICNRDFNSQGGSP